MSLTFETKLSQDDFNYICGRIINNGAQAMPVVEGSFLENIGRIKEDDLKEFARVAQALYEDRKIVFNPNTELPF